MSLAAARLDTTFAALADPTRRAIIARLAQGPASKDLGESGARMIQSSEQVHL